jgi:hypothetical protein
MKKLLKGFPDFQNSVFEHKYEMTPGTKQPSPVQAQKIQDAVRSLTAELRSVSLYTEEKKL